MLQRPLLLYERALFHWLLCTSIRPQFAEEIYQNFVGWENIHKSEGDREFGTVRRAMFELAKIVVASGNVGVWCANGRKYSNVMLITARSSNDPSLIVSSRYDRSKAGLPEQLSPGEIIARERRPSMIHQQEKKHTAYM